MLGLLCYIFFSVVIRREEHYLQATFAEIHSSYCKKVPRFFPRFSLYQEDDMLTVKPDRIYRTFLDGMVFFAAYPVFAIIALCQERGIVPVLLKLY